MHKGFTLIELLVVVLVCGILAYIALPFYEKAVERSRMSEVESLFGQVAKSQEVSRMGTNNYISSWDELEIDFPAGPDDSTYCIPARVYVIKNRLYCPLMWRRRPYFRLWYRSGAGRGQFLWGICFIPFL